MAFTMKHWVGVVLAGMAVITALPWAPGSSARPPRPEPLPPEVERHIELRREVRRLQRGLQQVRWADSLSALVVERALDGPAVVVPAAVAEMAETGSAAGLRTAGEDPLAAAEGLLERFRRAVRLDAEALGPTRPDIAVGYVYQLVTHGLEPGTPYSASPRSETYAGILDGVPYCLQVNVMRGRQVAEAMGRDAERADAERVGSAPAGRLLGPCGFYARHGLPGPHVRAWLEAGAAVMAAEADEDRYTVVAQGGGWLIEPASSDRRGAFGIRLGPVRHPTMERCLSGDPEACARAFLAPADLLPAAVVPALSGPAMVDSGAIWWRQHGLRGLLYDLEAEYGREAFGRFWRSELPVHEAFASATGTSSGPWVLRWIDGRFGIEPAGPNLPGSAVLGGFLTIALLAAVATTRQARRAVG